MTIQTTLRRRAFLAISLCAAIAVLHGCDDDPSSPGGGTPPALWVEVDSGVEADRSELFSVDCGGADCLATGVTFITPRSATVPAFEPVVLALASDGSWSPAEFVDVPGHYLSDVAVDADGSPVIAGMELGGVGGIRGVLYDGRTLPPDSSLRPTGPMLSVDGSGDFMVAGGSSRGGILMSSQVAGTWDLDNVPTTGTNDGGFKDVFVRGDEAVACGFDDGADTLQVVLRRTSATDWESLNRNGMEFGATLQCIALEADGRIHVGGILGAGGPGARAFLFTRSTAGEWTTVDLPDPEELGGVNDILLASDGDMYLACGDEIAENSTAQILRIADGSISPELEPFDGQIHQLAEADDGSIYAVGNRWRGAAAGNTMVILRRAP